MITTPEENIILTPEQSKQIEAVKLQIVNLQNEITIATKSLRVIQGESVLAEDDILECN